MRVLITGGAGFIGSHLADRLLAAGNEVAVIDNFATGRRENLPPRERLTLVEGSIAEDALVARTVGDFGPEVVVHAAAAYKDPEDWAEDARTNVLGSALVARAARAAGVRRTVYFQTSLCYGLRPLEQPITLEHPLFSGGFRGGSSYAISKTAGEQYLELGLRDFISFRLANAYGPRNLSGPLPTFYHRLTAGLPCFVTDTRRDFIYIEDLVEIALKAVAGDGAPGFYHVSSGSDFAIRELYDATVEALGLTPAHPVEERPRGADDAATILLDPSRANREFGWQVRTPLEEGVRATIQWYQAHGVARTYTHLAPPK